MNKLLLTAVALCSTLTSFGQNLTDGLMMQKGALCTGLMYTHDQWTQYWEGTLKRDNGNIGELTTTSIMWVGTYGVNDKVNIISMLPFVRTNASRGTLQGMEGLQDLSLGVKYNFYQYKTEKQLLRTFAVLNFSTPISDYTPDFYPLSLGSHTTNVAYRLNTYFRMEPGFFVNASAGYTWRSNTTLDRPSYYDGEDFYNSSEVRMPNVFDLVASVGYIKGPIQAEINFMQQNTLGGADIRRQDMPFVSNRMNFSKGGLLVMYYLPKPQGLALRGSAAYTFTGRNVGESTTWMAGALYTIKFMKPEEPTAK
jgi:hypothetical protein